ncbi:MAG TPA: hypothetical protein VFE82_05530 [Ramlibacter sp.]|jgi:hypothetical protein|uniref:hypothetical protein n=1 Tax=Ramlibacter sp. TaxID=1917967 RepID=UPI002D2F393A|nr:hypothetical protein [Ramlibacter sp.]HZY17922.1 hypothetical protein [Ramlibacter sp.]
MAMQMPVFDDSELELLWHETPTRAEPRRPATGWDAARVGNMAVWIELTLFTLAPALGFLLCWYGF